MTREKERPTMPSLKVPETGLILESSAASGNPVPPQAFTINLSDNVLEDMIKCVQSGEDLQLALGSSPMLLYGSSSHTLSPIRDPFSHDLFLTKPFESTKRATRLPQTSSLWKKLPGPDVPKKTEQVKAKGAPSTSSSGMDSDIENLQNSIAAATASKKQSRVMDRLAPANNKKATGKTAKSKLLSSMASYGNGGGKSSPSGSPALVAVSSPSTNPVFSSSQQVVEKFKEQRSMIVHELAVQERPYDYLESLWEGKEEDFRPALEKVAQFEPDTQMWALRKNYWRELDVWKYDYDTQDTRQKAIDNAIRQFDKMRLATTEIEWQKLLPREERGKGKILSKLQANIAKASSAAPPPKIKVSDATSDNGDEDVLKTKGGETMSRSSSNPLPAKPKKAADSQVKRLLSTNKKAITPKAAPSKTKERAPASSKNGRVLSAEFVTNSDSDSESSEDKPMATIVASKARPTPSATPVLKKKAEAPAPKPKIAVPKPKPRPVDKPAERPVERSTERPRDKSPQPRREAVKTAKSQPPKREREEEADDSSSSSGAPLAKRAKPKAPIKAPVSLKQRPADVSLASSRNSSGVSYKSKNTSPAKSSPLASSPPTNASELEHSAPPKKRKVMESSDSTESARTKPAPKRQRGLSPDLVTKAARFKAFYEKYETLHWEIADMRNPPQEKMHDLLEMRERLKTMKTEIYKECPPAIAVA
ncbi:Putative winged helix DNA-binding domain superfamily [Colletotrichum destructivum]|uniref:Winged helix DNA-binding domain superfamily n=2 Tax=Colletotrichum destructivum species complex TaxID=2707350 RepID=A0AAX4IV85_9PEZI|nr:Putative winged helix DNA-binding domain superfamily [Colletotrichum destructivum]